jgi:hypothetical protein
VSRARCAVSAAACALCLPCAGCITGCVTLSTAEVRVRDPASVALQTPSGDPLLPAGESDASVDRGSYGLLAPRAYEIRAQRDPTGAIALRCDACDTRDASFLESLSGTPRLELLDGAGRSRSVPSWMIDVDDATVSLSIDDCMVQHRSHCQVPARVRLVTPTSDVVEVRRRVEPVRFLGYFMLAGSAAFLAMGSYALLAPHSPAGSSLGERAPWAAAALVPGLVLGGFGLWEILTPAQEQVWRPARASGD